MQWNSPLFSGEGEKGGRKIRFLGFVAFLLEIVSWKRANLWRKGKKIKRILNSKDKIRRKRYGILAINVGDLNDSYRFISLIKEFITPGTAYYIVVRLNYLNTAVFTPKQIPLNYLEGVYQEILDFWESFVKGYQDITNQYDISSCSNVDYLELIIRVLDPEVLRDLSYDRNNPALTADTLKQLDKQVDLFPLTVCPFNL